MCFIWWLCKCNKVKLCSNTWIYANMLLEEPPHQWAKIVTRLSFNGWEYPYRKFTHSFAYCSITVLQVSASKLKLKDYEYLIVFKEICQKKKISISNPSRKTDFCYLITWNRSRSPSKMWFWLYKKWIVRTFSIIALTWAEFVALKQLLNIKFKTQTDIKKMKLGSHWPGLSFSEHFSRSKVSQASMNSGG